jgi:predicted protein tyrosine phosphatase
MENKIANKIFILAKPQFNDIMAKHDLNDSNVEEKAVGVAMISINDTIGAWSVSWFNEDHSNVLRLWFDDVETDLQVSPTNPEKCSAFTEEQAHQIIEFIDRNKDKNFFVHCSAGISRSGAVGTFILDYLQGDKDHFKQMNSHISPNAHISRTLNKIIWERQ